MSEPPVFTDDDIAELRRANKRLDRLPRVRMQTRLDRAIAHMAVLALEQVFAPAVRRTGIDIEMRSIVSRGRRLFVRILRPPGKLNGVHFDIHGGSWAVGNARMDDRPNAALAMALNVAVVSVEYGHAPRDSVRDMIGACESAASWLAENTMREFGTDKMTIGGESAGAHLAVCTLLKRRKQFRAALLYYGIYNLAGSTALCTAPPGTLVFHAPTMLSSLWQLTPGMTDDERRAPDISPAFADLSGLPPALLIAGTNDPLAAESEGLYASWLAMNDNADMLIVPEAPHAFNRMQISVARKTEAAAHGWLNAHLSAVSQ